MKKIFFPALAIAAIALASCAKQEVIDIDERSSNSIDFGVFVGKSAGVNTKAAVINGTTLKDGGFVASIYNTGTQTWDQFMPSDNKVPNWLNDAHVTWNSGTNAWTYSPVTYWPGSQGKLSFFAYASNKTGSGGVPIGLDNFEGGSGTAGATPSFEFTVVDEIVNQGDLLAATTFDKSTATNTQYKVNLAFDHILSKIGFSAILTESISPKKIEVTGVSVHFNGDVNVQTNGQYTFGGSTDGTLGTWDLTTVTPAYFVPNVSRDASLGTDVELDENTAQVINAADKFLMVVPQVIPVGSFYVKIAYNVINGQTTTPVEADVLLPQSSLTVAQGKQYTFNFSLSVGEEVVFDEITVTEWVTADPGDQPAVAPN